MEKDNTNKSNAALRPADAKSAQAGKEEAVLAFWKERDIFKKSLDKDAPKGEFVFYEGPPGANGIPMLHHFEARAFKDVIPRYKTMQGYFVDRRAGWDCHGLPVELQAEKELGITSKKEIETFGIAKYNAYCRETVLRYTKEWELFTDRMGYWVDNNRAYFTMANTFIESSWNIIAQAEGNGYLYKDYKILPWCSHCGTGLSTHELGQPGAYVDVKDLSVYAKFAIKGFDKAYFVAWTTTPWTLPGNVALAVGPDIDYVEAKVGDEILVMAKERLSLLPEGYEIVAEHKGSEVVGVEYAPLYEVSTLQSENSYKIYAADFVTTNDGTGIVHIAPMYGADDFELATKVGLPKVHTVGEDGKFKVDTNFLNGRYVKDEEVAVDIIKDLAHRGLLFKKEKYEHSYPHCWRCKTPLIYYARDSWYFAMSTLRDELVRRNETINWEPEHIKEGRFGEWLAGAKDWAISRERYWGTPLPIWVADDNQRIVIDSIATLKEHSKKSGNRYFLMRHGEAEHNTKHMYTSDPNKYNLTEIGKSQAVASSQLLNEKNIDVVYVSPFLRTKETSEIVARELGLSSEQVIIDERLSELNFGDFSERPIDEYWDYVKTTGHTYDTQIPGGESYQDAKNRFGNFLYDVDQKHAGKNVLVITHGIGLEVLPAVIEHADKTQSQVIFNEHMGNTPGSFVEQREFVRLPHNDNFELDLHRPYIDDVVLEKDGKEYRRIKEVMDVWFDSGAMPFAQDHYPFEHKDDLRYPADFISEAIDQTRGWFYTLLAVATLTKQRTPFKNAICLGHLLDAQGQKMSKSKGNVIEPWQQMNMFGADAVRFWMYSVTQAGDSKNYDEKTVAEINNKVFNLLGNVYSFYDLYRDKDIESKPYVQSEHVLDQWIIARLNELTQLMTEKLDAYDIFTPTRALREFLDDLSTWYLRRSRDRIKDGGRASMDGARHDSAESAKSTLYIVLKTTAQLLAPFAPFTAEDLWQKLRKDSEEESVHLSMWPKAGNVDNILLQIMEKVREFCTLGNAERKKLNIPVRQPLSAIRIIYDFKNEMLESLIKDELNVKLVIQDIKIKGKAILDTEITPELKLEGDYRELVRIIQDLRKEKGLMPQDVISLTLPTKYQEILNEFGEELKKTVGAKEVVVSGEEIVIQ